MNFCAAVCVLLAIIFGMHNTSWAEEADRYAVFRVVKSIPSDPSKPEITLPEGYGFTETERHHVASRAEYYTFVQGPENRDGVPVTVTWPGESIRAIIASNRRMELERHPDDPHTVTFQLPVTASSPNADQSTIQVWSHMDTTPGLRFRIEHNDPDRRAGPWTDVAWPANQARSAIHYLVASEKILIDSGVAAATHGKGHFIALMGFETNNTLHTDNPPHWHLAYVSGRTWSAFQYLPHYWINAEGRTFYNGMDVTGQGRTALRAGEPGPMYDDEDNLVLTTTIREDGGLDIDAPDGPSYAIVPGTDGDLVRDLYVERDGELWLRIETHDDVRTGVMIFRVIDEIDPANSRTTIHTYDRLTGALLEEYAHPLTKTE